MYVVRSIRCFDGKIKVNLVKDSQKILFASCRNEIGDEDKLSAENRLDTFELIVRNREPVEAVRGSADLYERILGKRVLFLVHGFNSDWEDVVASYSDLIRGIEPLEHYDEIIGFVWPGGDHAWDYSQAARRSKKVGRRLARIIRHAIVNGETFAEGRTEIDLLGHSMGCRVILNALLQLWEHEDRAWVTRVFLTAAAVNDEDLEKGERFYGATLASKQMTVFYSRRDRPVLCWAYKIGDSGDTGCALGFSGPEDLLGCAPHVRAVNCKRVVGGHNKYKNAPAFFDYLGKVLGNQRLRRYERL